MHRLRCWAVLVGVLFAFSGQAQVRIHERPIPDNIATTSGTLASGNSAGFDSSGRIVDTGRNYATDGAKLDGLPSSAYGLVGDDGSSMTARGRINLISGNGVTISCADNSGTNSTDCTASAAYTLQFVASGANPVDGGVYFYGLGASSIAATASGPVRIVFPRTGTVTRIDLHIGVGGTLGTTESITFNFRLNNTTDTLISSSAQASAAAQDYSATVSIAVVAGDYFEIRGNMPTWSTNPTLMSVSGSVYVQ